MKPHVHVYDPEGVSDEEQLNRILRLEHLGFQYIEYTAREYHQRIEGVACFVFRESFIATASDEEFEEAIQEAEKCFKQTSGSTVH